MHEAHALLKALTIAALSAGVLAATASAIAERPPLEDGTLSVKDGRATIQLRLKGSLIGRLARSNRRHRFTGRRRDGHRSRRRERAEPFRPDDHLQRQEHPLPDRRRPSLRRRAGRQGLELLSRRTR